MAADYAPNYEAKRALCILKNSLSERWRLHSEVSWEVARRGRPEPAERSAAASSLFGWPPLLLAMGINRQGPAVGPREGYHHKTAGKLETAPKGNVKSENSNLLIH